MAKKEAGPVAANAGRDPGNSNRTIVFDLSDEEYKAAEEMALNLMSKQ